MVHQTHILGPQVGPQGKQPPAQCGPVGGAARECCPTGHASRAALTTRTASPFAASAEARRQPRSDEVAALRTPQEIARSGSLHTSSSRSMVRASSYPLWLLTASSPRTPCPYHVPGLSASAATLSSYVPPPSSHSHHRLCRPPAQPQPLFIAASGRGVNEARPSLTVSTPPSRCWSSQVVDCLPFYALPPAPFDNPSCSITQTRFLCGRFVARRPCGCMAHTLATRRSMRRHHLVPYTHRRTMDVRMVHFVLHVQTNHCV